MEFPDEIIQNIVVKLPLKDVVSCMCVSKKWKDVITTESFWKNYTFYWYNFAEEEEPTGNLDDWQNDWYCYWDGSYDTPENEFVFTSPPKRWQDTKIIHPSSFDINQSNIPSYKDFMKCLKILQDILKGVEDFGLDCPAYGNEGSSSMEVCLFPWDKDQLPGRDDIKNIFTIDEHLCIDDASGEERKSQPLSLRPKKFDNENYKDDDKSVNKGKKVDNKDEQDEVKKYEDGEDDKEDDEDDNDEYDKDDDEDGNDEDDKDDDEDDNDEDDKDDDEDGNDEDDKDDDEDGNDEDDKDDDEDDNDEDDKDDDEDDNDEDDKDDDEDDNDEDDKDDDEDDNDEDDDEDDDDYGEYDLRLGNRIAMYDRPFLAAVRYFKWLQKIFVPSVMIFVGMEQMNPVPLFILTRLAPGWVGGFMTHITCT